MTMADMQKVKNELAWQKNQVGPEADALIKNTISGLFQMLIDFVEHLKERQQVTDQTLEDHLNKLVELKSRTKEQGFFLDGRITEIGLKLNDLIARIDSLEAEFRALL